MEGVGKRIFSNGDCYDGNFLRHSANTEGTLTKKDGSVYIGSWKQSKMNGEGVLIASNGDKFVGTFVDNKKFGKGTLFHKISGIIEKGHWENDEINSKIVLNHIDSLGTSESFVVVQPSFLLEGTELNPPILEAGEKITLKLEVKSSKGDTVVEESGRLITLKLQLVSNIASSKS